MIYTIGLTGAYRRYLRTHGSALKLGKRLPDDDFPQGYDGGYAFRTYDEAARRIAELQKPGVWSIFGLAADWDTDTEPSEAGWWHCLIRDAELIDLEG